VVGDRIEELSERRRRLWLRPWSAWTSDQEARVNYLNKLIGEAYADKRKEQAEGDGR
jgi:hypothetical protein